MNQYPLWKYVAVVIAIVLAIIYAIPNIYGEDPAIQISAPASAALSMSNIQTVDTALKQAGIASKVQSREGKTLLIRFHSEADQAKAKEAVQKALGKQFTVALNLANATPAWMQAINADPMKLGLDLRGGIHFLLEVDVASVIKHREQGDLSGVGQTLRSSDIRYAALNRSASGGLDVFFRNSDTLNSAYQVLSKQYSDFVWTRTQINGRLALHGQLSQKILQTIRENTMEQAIMTLRRRVNELGVSEPIVQQQGLNRISVDLPGIQDAARAQNIIGKTATLQFHMVDTTHDADSAANGVVPMGDILVYTKQGQPVLMYSDIILKGSSITSASSSIGQNGRPQVNVRLGGGGEEKFARTTAENVGKPMGTIYVETLSNIKMVDGKPKITYKTVRQVINVATILQPLGNNFQITNLTSMDEANNLALLLRAGSLPTTVTIVEEQTVGPSLGQSNINKGILSVLVGLLIVVVFMVIYYHLFGVIADIGLVVNLLFIMAIQSLIGAVLTLPGIAAMVLTLGMSVDANVLINERIREELRLGLSIPASIHAGYERALATIVDSNVTTLIAAIVLLSIGSGPVKGFAVTLTIGILSSMFTSFMVTRSVVNLIYGGKKLKSLSIGMNLKRLQIGRKYVAKND